MYAVRGWASIACPTCSRKPTAALLPSGTRAMKYSAGWLPPRPRGPEAPPPSPFLPLHGSPPTLPTTRARQARRTAHLDTACAILHKNGRRLKNQESTLSCAILRPRLRAYQKERTVPSDTRRELLLAGR